MDNRNKPDRIWLHVRSFERTLEAYLDRLSRVDHPLPLHRFMTEYFKVNRQMGSKDRRAVSRFIYHYLRLGQAWMEGTTREQLMMAEFLCSQESEALESSDLAHEVPGQHRELLLEMKARLSWTLEEKVQWLEQHSTFQLHQVFPWLDLLSDVLDPHAFSMQFLQQPDLFLRVRRGQESRAEALLERHELPFERVQERVLALPNGTSLDQIPGLKGLVEVQDWSSQRSLEDLHIAPGESWWDACSGAGGKSLLLLDQFPQTRLLVSDFRPSILRNLDERFERAGISEYRKKIIDLTKDTEPLLGEERFDGILLDVPCSGSGTWGRTPEMLKKFDPATVNSMAKLQFKLVSHALKHLKKGGLLVYITCSVFREENEDVVQSLAESQGLEIIQLDYKIGYHQHADTLFVGILKNNS